MDKKLKPGDWVVVIGQNGATVAVVSHSTYGANHGIAHYDGGSKSFAIRPEHKGRTWWDLPEYKQYEVCEETTGEYELWFDGQHTFSVSNGIWRQGWQKLGYLRLRRTAPMNGEWHKTDELRFDDLNGPKQGMVKLVGDGVYIGARLDRAGLKRLYKELLEIIPFTADGTE